MVLAGLRVIYLFVDKDNVELPPKRGLLPRSVVVTPAPFPRRTLQDHRVRSGVEHARHPAPRRGPEKR